MLKTKGCNYVRIRLWHNPTNGHSSFDEVKSLFRPTNYHSWLDVEYVLFPKVQKNQIENREKINITEKTEDVIKRNKDIEIYKDIEIKENKNVIPKSKNKKNIKGKG